MERVERVKVLPKLEALEELKQAVRTKERVSVEFTACSSNPDYFKPGKSYRIVLIRDWLSTVKFTNSVITFKAGISDRIFDLEIPLYLLMSFSYETIISKRTIEVKRVFGKDLGLKLIKTQAA